MIEHYPDDKHKDRRITQMVKHNDRGIKQMTNIDVKELPI